ncbi:MAG: Ig-like domain-containing protein [Muribaculaceae bacterium]|nr:Ig-like domain-containing protein [Muribaculaceae bacterium]
MKKFALMMALALPLALASCGDDNESTLTLNQNALNLDYGQTSELKASENGGSWASSNDFVVSVDNKGKLTANHEGRATVTVTKNGQTASCAVTVNATNNNFTTILTWGATKAQVMANVPNSLVLMTENDGNLMYSLPQEAYPWYGFFFENGSLKGSSVYFTDAMYDDYDCAGYIKQRYVKIENTDEGALYANAKTLSEATESAELSYDATQEVWCIMYQPVSHTKAAAIDYNLMKEAKAFYKSVKK